jgi:hypothetical protein
MYKKTSLLILFLLLFVMIDSIPIVQAGSTYTLRTGSALLLTNGYELTAKQIDVEDSKVWMELSKDGKYVKDEIMTIGSNFVYSESGNTFGFVVINIFQGQVDSLVQIDLDIILELYEEPIKEYYYEEETVEEQLGTLDIKSNPSGAEVWVDDSYAGRTPIEIDVEPGTYDIKIKISGYETESRVLTLSPGKTNRQTFTLERKVEEIPVEVPIPAEVPYTSDPREEPNDSLEILIIPIGFALILLVGIVIKKKGSKRKDNMKKPTEKKTPAVNKSQVSAVSEAKVTSTQVEPATKQETVFAKSSENKNSILASKGDNKIDIKSGFTYKGATIQYKVKVENPTSDPIGDVNVNLYVPNVFILFESTKSIPIIKPSESKTVTFDIRPTGECGDCEVSGKVIYYDYKNRETTEATIPPKNVSIVCPMLKSREITESEWRSALNGLTKAEESTQDIDLPASTLFDITSDVLQDINLFMLDPKINDSGNMYRGVSKFYGEGIKSLKYAAQIEVVGGPSKSKLILKAWAESEDALTGFYHGILDEIEKRVQVKGLIDTNVVNNYHYGDNIGTKITDSVVHRSNIGTSNDKCTGCGKDIVRGEKFCMSCGTAVV